MKILRSNEKGFTLIEILIALSLLAIISAVVIPNVIGFLGKGEKQAYNSDLKATQAAVDAYYTDPANRITNQKAWPLKGSSAQKISGGTPVWDAAATPPAFTAATIGYFIDFDTLVTKKYLGSVPVSASVDNKALATGSYSWYVDSSGKVQSFLVSDGTKSGFQDGFYP